MKHLNDVGMTYFKHLWFACSVSLILIKTGLLLLIHAIIPCILTDIATKNIRKLYKCM